MPGLWNDPQLGVFGTWTNHAGDDLQPGRKHTISVVGLGIAHGSGQTRIAQIIVSSHTSVCLFGSGCPVDGGVYGGVWFANVWN